MGGEIKVNVPPKARAVVRRSVARELFFLVQNAPTPNKSIVRVLAAADEALLEHSCVEFQDDGNYKFLDMEKPDEKIELLIERDAAIGIKHALVSAAKTAVYGRRKAILHWAGCFGDIFRKRVEIEAKLAESEELEEGAELDEMFKEDKPAAAPAQALPSAAP